MGLFGNIRDVFSKIKSTVSNAFNKIKNSISIFYFLYNKIINQEILNILCDDTKIKHKKLLFKN